MASIHQPGSNNSSSPRSVYNVRSESRRRSLELNRTWKKLGWFVLLLDDSCQWTKMVNPVNPIIIPMIVLVCWWITWPEWFWPHGFPMISSIYLIFIISSVSSPLRMTKSAPEPSNLWTATWGRGPSQSRHHRNHRMSTSNSGRTLGHETLPLRSVPTSLPRQLGFLNLFTP